MKRRILSYLGGCLSAAVGFFGVLAIGAVAEAIGIARSGVPFWRALAASSTAACLLGLPLTLAGGAVFPIGRRLLAGRGDGAGIDPHRLETLCALCIMAPLVIALGELIDGLLSGRGTRAIAMAYGAPVAAVAALWLASLGRTLLGRRPGARALLRERASVVFLGAVTAVVGTATVLLYTDTEVSEALSPLSYWAILASVPAAAATTSFLKPNRRATALALSPAALVLAMTVVHFSVRTSGSLLETVESEAPMTRLVDDTLFLLRRNANPGAAPDAVARCGAELSMPGAIGKATEASPDIVLVTVDALRCDHTTLCGYANDTTPLLAKWAARGALFTHAVSPSSTTRQSFGPMISGQPRSVLPMPPQTKHWGAGIGINQPTITTHLAAAGYHTALVNSRGWAFPRNLNTTKGYEIVDNTAEVDKQRSRDEGMASMQVDRVLDFLGEASPGRPTYIHAHLMEPHVPYPVPKGERSFGRRTTDKYDSAVSFVDKQLDRLLTTAAESRPDAATYFIITADHGEAFGEHRNRNHGHTVHQEEVRVPLLVIGPGIPARRIDAPVSLLDLLPTIAELAGLGPISGLLGESLVPVMREGAPPPDNVVSELVLDHKNATAAFRAYYQGRYKLIEDTRTGKQSLFDFTADPAEKKDLAGLKPEIVKRMSIRLGRLLHGCRAD